MRRLGCIKQQAAFFASHRSFLEFPLSPAYGWSLQGPAGRSRAGEFAGLVVGVRELVPGNHRYLLIEFHYARASRAGAQQQGLYLHVFAVPMLSAKICHGAFSCVFLHSQKTAQKHLCRTTA